LNTAAGRTETFALSRCRSLAGTGQHFAGPAGFHAPAFFKDAFGISQADKPWKMRLLFAREVATSELADLDGLGVQVHAVEVVLEDLPVEVEESALAAEFLQAGVGQSDDQTGIAFINGAKQAAEVVPERVRVVWVAVLEGVFEGFGGQQAVVFAKGAEQNAVQQLLYAAEDFLRGDGGILAA
jgi:hypothetical protein